MHTTKTERAEFIARMLDLAGIPKYGRASRISRDLQCAKAAATGWLNGSLPRDMELAFRFADFYEIDVREWVTGEKPPPTTDLEKMKYAIRLVKRFEAETQIEWGTDDFIEQVGVVLDDPKYQERHLADVVSILKKTKSGKART
tara:strand:- start:190 stop:621 length:432 start_codon:yes stop_codon:yes gene_type:complete